jgi:TIR domain
VDSRFDVFISYNRKDKKAVVQVAEKLRVRGLEVWLDDWEIPPGLPISERIDNGIRNCRSVAVFIGPDDVGPFQSAEIQAIIMEHVDRGIPAIPVLLRGASPDSIRNLSPLLTRNRWIDFNEEGGDDEENLYRLHWGITGKRPPRQQPPASEPRNTESDEPAPPVSQHDPVENALRHLSEQLRTQNVTYFVGPGAAVGCQPMPAQGCDIAHGLLCELNIIEAGYKGLLPPVGVAGMYYSARSGDRGLEAMVMEQAARALGRSQKLKEFPPAHDELAGLLKLLPSRPARRGGSKVPQLIVTTNLDLMMERALLRAGLSFTRIVQYRSGEQLDIDVYRNVQLGGGTVQLPPATAGGEPLRARVDELTELDRIIKARRKESKELSRMALDSIPWQEMPEPILYKFLGSQEVANSCVITTAHHFNFPRRVLQRNSIPAHITDIIANSTTLFLGPWFTDPDFQLTYYTLLCDAFRLSSDKRYAVLLPPQKFEADVYRQKMDSRVWEEIKEQVLREMGIKTVEKDVADFLSSLCGMI